MYNTLSNLFEIIFKSVFEMQFLFDLFPIILFFIAFKLKGVFVATAVAIAAAFVQIGWLLFRRRRIDPMLWVSFGLILVFGSITLWLQNETFIKWKPTVFYWLFALTLFISQSAFGKNLIAAMLKSKVPLPQPAWNQLNLAWVLFLTMLGALNLVFVYYFSTAAWVNFKLFGSTACFIIFAILQSLWMAKYLNDS
jgi:intracellular septation protein